MIFLNPTPRSVTIVPHSKQAHIFKKNNAYSFAAKKWSIMSLIHWVFERERKQTTQFEPTLVLGKEKKNFVLSKHLKFLRQFVDLMRIWKRRSRTFESMHVWNKTLSIIRQQRLSFIICASKISTRREFGDRIGGRDREDEPAETWAKDRAGRTGIEIDRGEWDSPSGRSTSGFAGGAS